MPPVLVKGRGLSLLFRPPRFLAGFALGFIPGTWTLGDPFRYSFHPAAGESARFPAGMSISARDPHFFCAELLSPQSLSGGMRERVWGGGGGGGDAEGGMRRGGGDAHLETRPVHGHVLVGMTYGLWRQDYKD